MSLDPLASKGNERGLCSGLRIATLCTSDIDSIQQFYVEGLGLQMAGPLVVDAPTVSLMRVLWGIAEDIEFDYYHLYRPSIPQLVQIRVLHIKAETPLIHASYNSREKGPFSLGFPNGDQHMMHERLTNMGFGIMADLQEGLVERPDGSSYRYWETIFQGPDFLHCVGIERGDGMPQLAPIDTESQMGGPGYSAFVTDQSDAELAFYTDVLGMELRADRYWQTSEGSALGIEPDVEFRFSLVYAPGTSMNHLLFLDYQDGVFEEANAAPRPPNRGLAIWSFETSDINRIIQNARGKEIEILSHINHISDPIMGERQVLTMITPSGFMVEVFE